MAVLALDLGGTKLAARLYDGEAIVIERRLEIPRLDNAGREIDAIGRFITSLLAETDLSVEACGLAAAPGIAPDGNVTRWPNRSYWLGAPLVSRLAGILGADIVHDDDGNAAALADAWTLGGRTLVHLCIGTGVGGGIIQGGRLHRGANRAAAEFGHMVVRPGGPRCTCGRHGCLQAVLSGPAIVAAAGKTSHAELLSALKAGDPEALSAVTDAADGLAQVIVTLSEILDPDTVSIGGGVPAGLPMMVERASTVAAASRRAGQVLPRIVTSPHGADASLVGAWMLARNHSAGASQIQREL